MTKLFENYPHSHHAKSILSKEEYGRLAETLKLLSKFSVDEMAGTNKVARKSDAIFLVKLKTQNNPRLYFTDHFTDKYILLHGLKKKEFNEDPKDLALAESRLKEMLDNED